MAQGTHNETASPRRHASSVPSRLSPPNPNQIGLPHTRTTYFVPVVMGLVVFVLFMVVRFAFS